MPGIQNVFRNRFPSVQLRDDPAEQRLRPTQQRMCQTYSPQQMIKIKTRRNLTSRATRLRLPGTVSETMRRSINVNSSNARPQKLMPRLHLPTQAPVEAQHGLIDKPCEDQPCEQTDGEEDDEPETQSRWPSAAKPTTPVATSVYKIGTWTRYRPKEIRPRNCGTAEPNTDLSRSHARSSKTTAVAASPSIKVSAFWNGAPPCSEMSEAPLPSTRPAQNSRPAGRLGSFPAAQASRRSAPRMKAP